jgi:hypothetical protein
MKLIECFSYVQGHKEAQEIVIDLNQMKSTDSKDFYIEYDNPNDNVDYIWKRKYDDTYLVRGSVTQSDWEELNLESDFLVI